MPLVSRDQRRQLCRQAVSQVSILIVARHHPDCRATAYPATGAESWMPYFNAGLARAYEIAGQIEEAGPS
jgi:hypothetical protein